MARVKLKFPNRKPLFIAKIPLRISDMNYGNHLGNDTFLSIIHEARVQWLQSLSYTELNVGGCGLIMADAMIAYKNQAYYGDIVHVEIFIDEISGKSFDVLYKLSVQKGETLQLIAEAKTGMACFDYQNQKISTIPSLFLSQLQE